MMNKNPNNPKLDRLCQTTMLTQTRSTMKRLLNMRLCHRKWISWRKGWINWKIVHWILLHTRINCLNEIRSSHIYLRNHNSWKSQIGAGWWTTLQLRLVCNNLNSVSVKSRMKSKIWSQSALNFSKQLKKLFMTRLIWHTQQHLQCQTTFKALQMVNHIRITYRTLTNLRYQMTTSMWYKTIWRIFNLS